MATFSVPSGCRQAMTDLHQAHSERFNKVVDKLKQMKVNQKEDHKLVAAFMDTHNVLRGALGKAMKHSEEMPDNVQQHLQAAAIHADDTHSSLISGRRGAGIGSRTVAGKPVGAKMAGQKVDPQTHLLKTIDDIRERYPQKPTGPR
jgi:ribosome assembly protein YihI (activator of Der GTPase)